MIDTKHFDDLARRIAEAMPAGVRALQQDVEKQVRSVLHQGFERMDLVTREDFDVQVALLERTRSRLQELEARVSRLEGKPPVPDTDSGDLT